VANGTEPDNSSTACHHAAANPRPNSRLTNPESSYSLQPIAYYGLQPRPKRLLGVASRRLREECRSFAIVRILRAEPFLTIDSQRV